MNPSRYFKFFIILNTSALVFASILLILSNYISYNDQIQHELVVLSKSHKESILKENFRDVVSSLDIEDDKYFLKIMKEARQVFQNGNIELLTNGHCEKLNIFQFQIEYCRESVSLGRTASIFLITTALILAFGVVIFSKINKSLKEAFQTFFDVIRVQQSSQKSLQEYWNSILLMAEEFRKNQERLIILERQKAFSELTTKVAHDIRSPLVALSLIKEKIDKNSDVHEILDATISRIHSIADDVLKNRKEGIHHDKIDFNKHEVSSLLCITATLDMMLDEIFKEKKMIYPELQLKKIKNNSAEQSFFSQVKIIAKPEDVGRIFSNLIDNSEQALHSSLNEERIITYEMLCDENHFAIRVKDNGPGIEPSILKQLGSKELTTKPDGNGIALAYAKKLLRSWNGDLTIESEKDKFTTVTISLARTV